jgi:hypothetical protein
MSHHLCVVLIPELSRHKMGGFVTGGTNVTKHPKLLKTTQEFIDNKI